MCKLEATGLESGIAWYYLTPLIRSLIVVITERRAACKIRMRYGIKKIAGSLINRRVLVRVENYHREISVG